jgi:hypothetical protein
MQKFIFILSFFISLSYTLNARQIVVRNCQQSKANEKIFVFPIVTILGNESAALRMNNYMQINLAEQTTRQVSEENLFSIVHQIDIQTGVAFGIDGTQYEVLRNTPEILSMQIHCTFMGAHPDFFVENFNFNGATGDILLLEDLFTQKGLSELKAKIRKLRTFKLNKHVYQLRKDKNYQALFDENKDILNDWSKCMVTTDDYHFLLSNDSIYFNSPNCLSHAMQALDGNFKLQFAFDELATQLSEYGKQLLIRKVITTSFKHQTNFNRPLYGTIGNSLIMMDFDTPYEKNINAQYYYERQGRAIQCHGTEDKGLMTLKCNCESDKMIDETIIGKMSKQGFKGTWKNGKKEMKIICR